MKLFQSAATVFFFLLAGIFHVAIGQATVDPHWKTLDLPKYAIQYPVAWQLDLSGKEGSNFVLLSPKTAASDGFQANINLLTQDLSGYGLDLDTYVQVCFGQLRQLATNFHVIATDKKKTSGNEHFQLIYTTDQGEFKLQMEQMFWVVNDQAYVLTLTCEADKFEAYQEIGEKILNTFVVK